MASVPVPSTKVDGSKGRIIPSKTKSPINVEAVPERSHDHGLNFTFLSKTISPIVSL